MSRAESSAGPSESTPEDSGPPWHARASSATLDALDTDPAGLTADEAARRRAEHGPNELVTEEGRSLFGLFLAQFTSPLIVLLIVAAIASYAIGHPVDATLIAIIVVANGIFGFVQEYRAEQSLAALRDAAAPEARVVREGEERVVTATELVPGDVIVVAAGDVVSADARIVETSDLGADESALTGESQPVDKSTEAVAAETTLADRTSMIHRGTNVTRGRARAVVTATGMDTAVGAIADQLQRAESRETPLQRDLGRLGRRLGIGVVLLALALVPLLLWGGTDVVQAGLTAVSLAVAAVPEGLPAVVTLTLALGVRRMAGENALVRRLPAVEALGSVDVVCTDKTGTLTKGEMSLTDVVALEPTPDGGQLREVDRDEGAAGEPADPDERVAPETEVLRLAAAAEQHSEHPLAQAIVDGARERGIDVTDSDDFENVPGHGVRATVDGQTVLVGNRRLLEDAGIDPTPAEDAMRRLESEGKTAMLVGRVPADAEAADVTGEVIGVVADADTVKETAADAVSALRERGVDVRMITGDNERTARAVAEQVGIDPENVRAEVLPDGKADAVDAIQAEGRKAMMVGDGVNDAPALAAAFVGTAIGSGTDVAIEAADVTLMRDDPTDVVKAIRVSEGTLAKIKQNLFWALGYNTAMIPLASLGLLQPILAAGAMALSSVSVLTNSLLFRRYTPDHDYRVLGFLRGRN